MISHQSNVIHQIGSDVSAEVAYYRFLKNKRVEIPQMISHIVQPLSKRVKGRHVLILGDTTSISLKKQIEDIRDSDRVGVLSDNKTPGFHLHLSMCLDAESGCGLGLSDMMVWNRAQSQASAKEKSQSKRSRSWSEKESYKWPLGLFHSLGVVSEASTRTFIFDAESDSADFWKSLQQLPVDAIIRLQSNRKVKAAHGEDQSEIKLLDHMAAQKVAGEYTFELRGLNRRNYSRNKVQNRQAREAKVEVRFTPVALPNLPDQLRPYYIVQAKESSDSVPQGEEPIHWLLLTTHPVETFSEAREILKWYAQRWMIEQLFRISKRQGFDIEASELEYLDSILKQTLATMQAAFQVMALLLARGEMEGQPIEEIFDSDQIQCLKALNRKYQGRTKKQQNPYPPDKLSWATWVIARLGGWKGLSTRRPPGPIILFRGLNRFNAIFEGWMIQINVEDVLEP